MSSLFNKKLQFLFIVGGMWPWSSNIFGLLLFSTFLITTFPFLILKSYMILDNFTMFMSNMSYVVLAITLYLKYCLLWTKRSRIKDLTIEIINDWNREVIPKEWKIIAHKCHSYFRIDFSMYTCMVMYFYIDAIFDYSYKKVEDRELTVNVHYTFDYHLSPNYEIIQVVQFVQVAILAMFENLIKNIIILYVYHIAAHITTLKLYIKQYSKNLLNNYYAYNPKSLKLIINEHKNIIRLVKKVDVIYRIISQAQLTCSNIIIAVILFMVITTTNIDPALRTKLFFLLVVAICQTLTFCLAGQYLSDKSDSICKMLYNCAWYNANPKEIKAIIFLIKKTQIPLTISNGAIFELSLNSFARLVHKSKLKSWRAKVLVLWPRRNHSSTQTCTTRSSRIPLDARECSFVNNLTFNARNLFKRVASFMHALTPTRAQISATLSFDISNQIFPTIILKTALSFVSLLRAINQ